jgi:hypothetical protein
MNAYGMITLGLGFYTVLKGVFLLFAGKRGQENLNIEASCVAQKGTKQFTDLYCGGSLVKKHTRVTQKKGWVNTRTRTRTKKLPAEVRECIRSQPSPIVESKQKQLCCKTDLDRCKALSIMM